MERFERTPTAAVPNRLRHPGYDSGDRTARLERTPTRDVDPIETQADQTPWNEDETVARERSSNVLINRKSPIIGVETEGPRRIRVGKPAKYKVSIQNTGDLAATDVKVNVKIPSWNDISNAKATAGTTETALANDRGVGLSWKISNLQARSLEELILWIVPRESRPFDLEVEWSHSPVASQTLVEVQEAKLEMNVIGPAEVVYGQREMYKLSLSNRGTADAENIIVQLLPTDPGETEIASHPIGLVVAGETKVIDLELVARKPGTLLIKAEATGNGAIHATAEAEVLVRRAELKIDMTGPKFKYAGTDATYHITVSNPGNATARNVHVSTMLPPGTTIVSTSAGGRTDGRPGKIEWSLGTLHPNDEATFETRCTLGSAGRNRPQAVCVADDDLRDSVAIETLVEAVADLVLEVDDPPGPVPTGEDVTYHIRVRNRGSSAAESVELVAFFTNGIEPVLVEGQGHTIQPGQVILQTISSLAAGQEGVFKIVAQASQPGVHIIRVQLRCESLGISMVEEETTRCYSRGEIVGRSSRSDSHESEPYKDDAPRSLQGSDVDDATPLESDEP